MSLRERVEAELARREQVARRATTGPWAWEHVNESVWDVYAHRGVAVGVHVGDVDSSDDAAHIALHDPADALARYAAARRVLERHGRDHIYDDQTWSCVRCVDSDLVHALWPCDELLDVAASLGVVEVACEAA